MDFSFTQEQEDLKGLAAKILDDMVPGDALPRFEEPQDWYDGKLWGELAKAQLLGLALPEDVGGMGMGFIEVALLLEQVGRTLAPVPCLPTLVMAAAPIAEFGSPEQKQRILPDVVAGRLILTAALLDDGARAPYDLSTTAARDGADWRLDGVKSYVPAASLAGRIVVSARTADGGPTLFLVDPAAGGLELEAVATTTGENQYRLSMAGTHVEQRDVLGRPDDGVRILEWIVEHTLAGLCAMELGVAERALGMTAKYTSERKQFDKPIATFQAVAQRAADAYIDVEAIRLATWQAVWRLATGRPAAREVAIAKFWAADGGHRACYAAQHLHGGIGVDTDYPLHHYYLMSREIELTLGAAHAQLARLGAMLAVGDAAAAS
jgi:alkylation response protein AidB-like acyl-CoA dehydrogenase